ncbi:MFS transporter [Streptomyces sp. NPDC091267]|uniref:MFS transporter n=1 Tax=unclassified Streptomyces TaxID=2593676 RepID=UPI00342E52DB
MSRLRAEHAIPVYLAGFTLTNVGVGGFTLAVGLAFYEKTGSASTFGLLVALEYAIGFVGQLVGGSVLDRYSTLGVALLTNSVRCLFVFLGGVCLLLTDARAPLTIAFVISAFIRPQYRSASFVLSRQVSPPSELKRINSLRSAYLPAAKLTGLGVVALLAAFFSSGVVLCVLTVFFLAGTLGFAALKWLPDGDPASGRPDGGSVRPTSLAESWGQLARALKTVPSLCVHLVLSGMPATLAALAAVLVAPVNHWVHGGSYGIAVLDGGVAVGALCSITVARRLATRTYLVAVACALSAAALILLAVSRTLLVAGISFWLLGVATTLGATTLDTFLQIRASEEILGRLFITQEFVISLTAVALLPVSGEFASDRGIPFTASVYAAVSGLYLLLFLASLLFLRQRIFGDRVDLKRDADGRTEIVAV